MDDLEEFITLMFLMLASATKKPSLKQLMFLVKNIQSSLGDDDGHLGKFLTLIMDCLILYETTSTQCSFSLDSFLNYVKSRSDGTTLTSLSPDQRSKLTYFMRDCLTSHKNILAKLSCGARAETMSPSHMTASTRQDDVDAASEWTHLFSPGSISSPEGHEQSPQCPTSTGSIFCFTCLCKRDKFALEEHICNFLLRLKLVDMGVEPQDIEQYWKGKVIDMMNNVKKGTPLLDQIDTFIRDVDLFLQQKGATRHPSRKRSYPF